MSQERTLGEAPRHRQKEEETESHGDQNGIQDGQG